jgi:hypothetical protein
MGTWYRSGLIFFPVRVYSGKSGEFANLNAARQTGAAEPILPTIGCLHC